MDILQNIDWQDLILRLLLTAVTVLLIWQLRRVIIRILLPLLKRYAQRNHWAVDDLLLDTITTPVHLVIIALGIHVAALILSADGVPTFIEHLSRSLVIVALFSALYKIIGLLTRTTTIVTSTIGLKIDKQLLPFMRTALQVILMALAVVIVLQEWEYDVGGLIAGLGLGGLAFALAAEDTVANLFGFTTIVGDRPLVQGEFIVTSDVTGVVERVGFRSTRIRQMDQAIVTIPNSTLANSVITNWSRLQKRWINMTIGVTYHTTPDQMRELLARLEQLLKDHEDADPDSVTVLFNKFGDSALEVMVRAYLRIADWTVFMKTQQGIMLEIMDIVSDLGLTFAFPSQSLYIEQVAAGSAAPLAPKAEETPE